MKILALSDVHFEFHNDYGLSFIKNLNTDANTVIIAGDIAVYNLLDEAIGLFCSKFSNVIYASGNHDFYGGSPSKMLKKMQKLQKKYANLFWLNNSSVVINNKKFIGSTLWFEKEEFSDRDKSRLSDFYHIQDFDPWVYEENKKSLNYLEKNVDNESIVITHHMPSWDSVSLEYYSSVLNKFFLSPSAEKIILEKKPKLWIHGHTHTSFDYILGNTRIYCNPYGYTRKNGVENNNFSLKTIEI
jgi:Icc-related predicted phosphoesterase